MGLKFLIKNSCKMKRTTIQSDFFVAYYHHIYKRKGGYKKGTISNYDEVLKLLSTIWETVYEHYMETDGGVYIDNIGYLCHPIIPAEQKFIVTKTFDNVIREETNGRAYRHTVLDFAEPKRFYHLVLQEYNRKKAVALMNKGKRYRFMYNEVMAKKHIFNDFKIKKVFEDRRLKHKKLL